MAWNTMLLHLHLHRSPSLKVASIFGVCLMNIVNETNRYAKYYVRGRGKTSCYDTNLNEIRVFLDIVLLQSIARKPVYRHFYDWKMFIDNFYIFKIIMNLIQQIILPQNSTKKILPIYDDFNRKLDAVTPQKFVIINESFYYIKVVWDGCNTCLALITWIKKL